MPKELNNDNYFSTQSGLDYMSYSQFSNFMTCENKALAKIKGEFIEPSTKSMLVGSYVDAYFSGEMDQFILRHGKEVFKKDGSLAADFIVAEKVIKAIESDHGFLELYKNGDSQTIETGEIAGVPFKIKMDVVNEFRIVDEKVMKDCEDIWTKDGKVPFWKAYHYDIQAAIYQEIHAQNCGRKLPYFLAVATKAKGEKI